jgi:NADH-quinone oxidoreductase subunit G
VRQALGHAGEVRPGFNVLSELCERLGAGATATGAPVVTAELAAAVPFYAGLTLEVAGGRGVRWQEREAASALEAGEPSAEPLVEAPAAPEGMTLVAAPTLWQGGEVPLSPSLAFLAPSGRAELSPEDARRLEIEPGSELELAVDGAEVRAAAAVRTGVPAGAVLLSPAGLLPEGPVEMAPARTRVEVAG